MLTPESTQSALASGALPSTSARRPDEAARATGVRSVLACGRELLPQRIVFAGCAPEPRWVNACARRGIQIETASADEAVRALREQPPACLVIDADLGAEGHAALRAELTRGAGTAAVALLASAPALFAVMAEWKAFGAAHVLLKPIELDELLTIVEPAGTPPAPRLPSLERLQREYIRAVLVSCEGNVSEAARQLGMYRQSLQRMLRRQSGAR